jgi:hypothetical protein
VKYSILLLIACVGTVFAETEPPAIVTDGLNAYWRNGGKAAWSVWVQGSSLENELPADAFAGIEKAYGRMIGYETIRVTQVCPSMQRVYMLVKYERGPAYFSFDCYKTEKDWIIPIMSYNTKPAAILPERMLVSDGR